MLLARQYTTFLEVEMPDGSRCAAELTVTPTGFYNINQASVWTRLLSSLARRESLTKWQLDLDSLRGGRQGVLPF